MVPGRFKDYISTPKQNDYRSIHTTIVGPSRQRIELQIRTREMNKVAEYGVAVHALYKDAGGKVNGTSHAISKETNAYAWLRRTIEQLAEGDNPEEFLENTKLELFQDQVFCFTPKGMLIALPRGATPIDFAYAVHTDVGDTCVGAKVNGRIMPLMTELKNGDEVEIIRSKAQVPPAAWESVVVTGKARSAIRRATKNAIRKQYSGLGARILERAFERAGKTFSKDGLKPVLHRLARKDIEDVLSAVGRGELASSDVMKAVFPDFKDERITQAPKVREEGWSKIRNAAGMLFQMPGRSTRKEKNASKGAPLPIRGVRGDLPVRFAPEGAVPGDRIVGIVQPGTGITIYPIQSPSLQAFDDQPERWIDVRWDIDESTKERFPARISVTAINAPGSLAEIAQVIAVNDANIHTLSMIRTAPDFTEMLIDLEVWDLKHLNRLLSQLKDNSSVSDTRRVNG
jgi:guanosine-3',5'-bis(diphosphate) 3'-pyrophosphohydrolase